MPELKESSGIKIENLIKERATENTIQTTTNEKHNFYRSTSEIPVSRNAATTTAT